MKKMTYLRELIGKTSSINDILYLLYPYFDYFPVTPKAPTPPSSKIFTKLHINTFELIFLSYLSHTKKLIYFLKKYFLKKYIYSMENIHLCTNTPLINAYLKCAYTM